MMDSEDRTSEDRTSMDIYTWISKAAVAFIRYKRAPNYYAYAVENSAGKVPFSIPICPQ